MKKCFTVNLLSLTAFYRMFCCTEKVVSRDLTHNLIKEEDKYMIRQVNLAGTSVVIEQ